MSTVKRISPFGEIATFVSGNRPQGGVGQIKKGALSLGGEHVGVDGKLALTTPKFVPLDYYNANPKGHINAGDILLCKDGALSGKVALERGELSGLRSMVNEHVFIIRTDKLDQKYLFYYLFSPVGQSLLKGIVTGAAQGGINGKNLKSIPVVFPDSISKQCLIVDEMDLLTGILDKKNQQLRHLDALAQSIFYEMFGDPVTNDKGWKSSSIGEIASVKIGPFGSLLHKEDYISGGTPLVNPIHMKELKIVPDNDFTISDSKKQELNSYLLHSGDIVVARRGDIGRCALVEKGQDGYLCGTGSLFIRPQNEVLPEFLVRLLSTKEIVKTLTNEAKGVTMLNINCDIINKLKIIIPDICTQKGFAERIAAIESQKQLIWQSIADSRTLLSSRMDYYFND